MSKINILNAKNLAPHLLLLFRGGGVKIDGFKIQCYSVFNLCKRLLLQQKVSIQGIMRTFLKEKLKIVSFGLKNFLENVFIQTTVYILSVWFCEWEKQFVFQIFKNGYLLRNFENLQFWKKIINFEKCKNKLR